MAMRKPPWYVWLHPRWWRLHYRWQKACARWRRCPDDTIGWQLDMSLYLAHCSPAPGLFRMIPPVAGCYPHHYPDLDVMRMLIQLRFSDPRAHRRITRLWSNQWTS